MMVGALCEAIFPAVLAYYWMLMDSAHESGVNYWMGFGYFTAAGQAGPDLPYERRYDGVL